MKQFNKNTLLKILTIISVFITIAVLGFIIIYIVIQGIPYLKPSLFSLKYTSENISLVPALINTIIMSLLTLLVSAPIGIFAAIYLTQYTSPKSKIVKVIRITTETLSGIPSIVYGLFGLLFFVTFLGLDFSILSGALTLSIMVLPLIIRSTEEALIAVPSSYKEAAFGLGARNIPIIFRIILPSAIPGILSGLILTIGRIVGETAALIYTAGTVAQIPTSLDQSARTLAIHMYVLSSEGKNTGEAYATAIVLLLLVIGINMLSTKIAKRLTRR